MPETVLAGYAWKDRSRSGHVRVEGVQGKCVTWGVTCGGHARWLIPGSSENQWSADLWAPASKCSRSGYHDCVAVKRSCVTVRCVRCRPAWRACRMGLNHICFTNIACNWVYLLHLVSLSFSAPAPSYLFFPGYCRLEKDIAMENRCCSWTIQLRSL